ncbi:MAG TPA: helix-turn-helix transcriptional regulator [Streptosporangiaceae bacterium]|jgi:transcriptional regulator with XRE-family HTH domain
MGIGHVANRADNHPFDYRQAGPTAVRMLVGAQLRRFRLARGITREDAAKTIHMSASRLSRLERGRIAFKERDVAGLLTHYQVTDPDERHAVLMLARQANAPGWWAHYPDVVPHWFEPYLTLELAARVIRTYEVQFVPGLLQTADYARAVIRLAHDEPERQIQRRVSLRMDRQHILTRPDPPQLWAVIDESALRRPFGGVATHRAQLRRLLEITDLPYVTLQVMPFDSGGHVAAGGAITVLRFAENDLPDVVYLEQLASALYLDRPGDVMHYRDVMNRLSVQAEPPAASKDLLHRALAEL